MRAHHTHLLFPAALAMVSGSTTFGQVAYPDHVIQDVSWTSGTHHTAVTNKILSPGAAWLPVSISGTADAEFVSATQVHLADGFHAGGFSGAGQFHAYIDQAVGPAADLVVITPDPAVNVIDNVLHVNKWEKLELGLQLPQEYQDAIDRFFDDYYDASSIAVPNNLDRAHDLNPYADDSLVLVITLIDPAAHQRMKWGFFMKEGKWASTSPYAMLAEDFGDPYHIRFRFAPDLEGDWTFTLMLQAPHTSTLASVPLSSLQYTGYGFVCDAPLPDNHGFLQVNSDNHKTLRFEDETPFFGLGSNLADFAHLAVPYSNVWKFFQSDFTTMNTSMDWLHASGGNFLRMFLMRHAFAPEWVNLGVYDLYRAQPPCDGGLGEPFTPGYVSNCQFQCWAFDQLLDHARANQLYVQLCIDPYPPMVSYEGFLWGNHPYMINFLQPHPQSAPLNRYDLKDFFFTDGSTTDGVFYYWKRKYKYLMARWGYSVNIAAIEPFNEIDQMLSYRDVDLSLDPDNTNCPENKVHWLEDTDLPETLDQWVSEITGYVKDNVDPAHPATSPLGEDKRLFAMSYIDGLPAPDPDYHTPFDNPNIDIVDVHKGLYWGEDGVNNSFEYDKLYRNQYAKPFHNGEYSTYSYVDFDNDPLHKPEYETWKVFSNYDVAFHNQIWASAFFGGFTVGTDWNWTRVFWWPGTMKQPEADLLGNPIPHPPFSNLLNYENILNVGTPLAPIAVPVRNRTLQHHFEPLSDLLSYPEATEIFSHDFVAYEVHDPVSKIECYYLVNADQNLGVGWVHNLNAYWEKQYYITNGDQHFLDCTDPGTTQITLSGFQTGMDFHVTYFSTRMNNTAYPISNLDETQSGSVLIDLTTLPLRGLSGYHLDTLRSDYAFIIAPGPVVRGMDTGAVEYADALGWGRETSAPPTAGNSESLARRADRGSASEFHVFPNPAHDVLNIILPDEAPREIVLCDVAGRRIQSWSGVSGKTLHLHVGHLSEGAYYLCVTDDKYSKTVKLIIL